jgi:nucleotide-binding universal stress UspA family protein
VIRIQNILVPVDFSEAFTEAVHFAAELALAYHARLYVLHVREPFPVHGRIAAGSLEDVQKHRIQKEKAHLSKMIPLKVRDSIAVQEIQVTGMPVHRVIVEKARKLDVDVIVMASQDRKGFMRFIKKNIAEQVLHDAPCAVFVIRDFRKKDTPSGEKGI